MTEEKDDFVELMLKKAEKKEVAEPNKPLSPEKDPETKPNMDMTEDDIKSVEEFTENLKKKMQE